MDTLEIWQNPGQLCLLPGESFYNHSGYCFLSLHDSLLDPIFRNSNYSPEKKKKKVRKAVGRSFRKTISLSDMPSLRCLPVTEAESSGDSGADESRSGRDIYLGIVNIPPESN